MITFAPLSISGMITFMPLSLSGVITFTPLSLSEMITCRLLSLSVISLTLLKTLAYSYNISKKHQGTLQVIGFEK